MHVEFVALLGETSLDTVGPDELLGDGTFGDLAQVCQIGTILEVHVHAVTEAVMGLSTERVLVHAERVFGLSSAGLEALQRHESDFLSESKRAERLLNLLLLCLQFFGGDLHGCSSDSVHCL